MLKRAVTLALIAMTLDRAIGGGGGGGSKNGAKSNLDGETNLFDLSMEEEEDDDMEADDMDKEAGSAFKSEYVPCEKALIERLRGGERKNDTGQKVRERFSEHISFCLSLRYCARQCTTERAFPVSAETEIWP